MAMAMLASLLTWTTQPLAIVAALRLLGRPLARIGLPVDTGATAIGLALRFAPIALSEARTLMRAQVARGADFRGLRAKLTLAVPLLGTLFERAFARADTLAQAMDARSYLPRASRTYFRTLGWHGRDLLAACFVAAWLLGSAALG